jgi:hypothetical protein
MTYNDPTEPSRARADARARVEKATAERARRAAARRTENLKLIGLVLAIVAVIALIIWGFYYEAQNNARHTNRCHARGGTVSSHTTYHHEHTDTMHYCFTDHGQIDQW